MTQYIDVGENESLPFPDDMPDAEIAAQTKAYLADRIQRQTPQQERPQRTMVQQNYTQPPARRMEGLPAAPDAVPPTPNTLPWYIPEGNALRTIVRGTGRGIASALDLPVRGVDWGARNIFDYTPPGTPTPFTDVFDAYAPAPVQGYERMHELAETYGPSVIAAPIGGATSLIGRGASYGVGVLGNVASTILGQAAGTVGEKVGSTIGGAIGGERGAQIGGDIGSTGLAVATPTIAARSGERSIRRQLTDADTPRKLEVLREAGVTPTLDLVGNEKARTIADAARKVPILGAPAKEMRTQQLAEVNRAGQEIAADVRGGPASTAPVPVAPVPPSAGTIGGVGGNLFGSRGRSLARQRANAAAQQAATPQGAPATGPITKSSVAKEGQRAVDAAILKNEGTISNIGDAIEGPLVGRDTVGPSRNIDETVRSIEADPGRGSGKIATLKERVEPMLTDRKHPIDPQLGQALEMKRAFLENRLQQNPSPALRAKIEAELVTTAKQIDENTGSTYGALKDNRGDIRKPIKDKPSPDTHLAGKVEDAHTEAMAGIAEQQGMPRADWDEFQKTQAERKAEIEYLEQAKAKREGGQGFNKLFSKDNEHDVKMREIIEKRAPAELRTALADHLELKTRGKGSAGRPEISAKDMKGKIADWWNELDAENKAVITGRDPDLVKRMDALAKTDELIKGPETLSSTNLGSGSGPNMIPNAASRSLGAILSGHVSGILPAITPVLMAGATRKLSDPNFAARVAGPPRNIVDIFNPGKTALWAHGAEPGETERKKEPLRFTVRAKPE